MRRTLPRLFALPLLVLSLVAVSSTKVSAQEQIAASFASAATVLPASMTSTVLFPATATVAGETVTDVQELALDATS